MAKTILVVFGGVTAQVGSDEREDVQILQCNRTAECDLKFNTNNEIRKLDEGIGRY